MPKGKPKTALQILARDLQVENLRIRLADSFPNEREMLGIAIQNLKIAAEILDQQIIELEERRASVAGAKTVAKRIAFKPFGLKRSESGNLTKLRSAIKEGDQIKSVKNVGEGSYKIYMEGPINYYVETSQGLIKFLRSRGISL